MIRLAMAQINVTVGDLTGNQQLILSTIERARDAEADLVVFPEMVVTGYPTEDLLYKDHFVADNIETLNAIAERVKSVVAVIGFVDTDDKKRLYNAAAVVADGKIQGIYHKEELPNYGVFDEKRYFTPGRNNHIYSLGYDYFAVNICEDIWIEDGVHCQQSEQGASLIINISSSPYDIDKHNGREQMLRRRAQQTNAVICYTNLVGGQDELVFDGGSMIVGPDGEIIASARRFEADFVVTDIQLGQLRERKYKPFDIVKLERSSRPDRTEIKPVKAEPLSQLESVYHALILGTHDYVTKNGFSKVLIGLSGGIDSALVAALAAEALGSENVVGVTMPSRYTSDGTRSDAHQLAENLGIECLEIPIEGMFESYLEALKPIFKDLPPNIAEENIQARIRGNILMAISNKFGWMVLTTGNKSEMAVGYCTLYGDMSGGFAVIKDIPKTRVYALSEYINERLGERIPVSTIERAPSAELRENQKDQDSLPEYHDLDLILEGYVEQHKSLSALSQSVDAATVRDVIRKVDLSEYKRRQAPLGIKITSRSFGKDWRLPITNKYREET